MFSLLVEGLLNYWPRLPVITGEPDAQCGYTCLRMVLAYHGFDIELDALLARYPVASDISILSDMIGVAQTIPLATRALKLEFVHLPQLRLPCILHWENSNFVVLKKVEQFYVVVHHPQRGKLRLTMPEVVRSFSNIALELWPDKGFVRNRRLFLPVGSAVSGSQAGR